MKEWSNALHISVLKNDRVQTAPGPEFLSLSVGDEVRRFHSMIPGYGVTPLVSLEQLAAKLGVRAVYVKDESHRFGQNAFKGLGGIYSVSKVVCSKLGLDLSNVSLEELQAKVRAEGLDDTVFITATDGNHGRGIAWAANLLGCKAVVFMPSGSSQARAEAIRRAGKAEVTITDLSYDDTVRLAARTAEANRWHLVQDTSWEGYTDIPTWIVQGYITMAAEAAEQLQSHNLRPTHVFLQAGVGAMSGAMVGYLANRYQDNPPVFSVVEPSTVACIYQSAAAGDGAPRTVDGIQETIMAGLNCGAPCTVTWPVLRDLVSYYFSCPDFVSAEGVRTLHAPVGGDTPITSGESGAVTTGLVKLLMEQDALRQIRDDMGLGEHSVVLLFSTEGCTDPDCYNSIVYGGSHPIPQV